MKPNKKKPRIRNRPRNKANRLKAEEDGENEVNFQQGEVNGNETPKNLNPSQEESDDDDDDLPGLEEDGGATAKTLDPNEAIKTIQRLLRERMLKNQQKAAEANAPQNFESARDTKAKTLGGATKSSKVEASNEPKAPVNQKSAKPDPSKETKAANNQKSAKMEASKDAKPSTATSSQKSGKSKEKSSENKSDKGAFIQNLQKKMEAMLADGDANLENNLMANLKKLLDGEAPTDIVSSDEEEEVLEYVYKPRKYFIASLCNLCKIDLCKQQSIECSKCHMTYYCSVKHMQNDAEHRPLCSALRKVAAEISGGHIFDKCSDMTPDQFRSYRIVTIRNASSILQRPLTATEQEVILFPRLCMHVKCRKFEFKALQDCADCGMVSYCCDDHVVAEHKKWCTAYHLFKELIIFQEKFGRLDPGLPSKVLKETPTMCNNTKEVFLKLGLDIPDNCCEYAALTQISTGPLTAWYALKATQQLNSHEDLTIHLIGAEIEFEVDVLNKWELFFLHITHTVKNLNVVFVGPELNPNNISFDQLKKTKCCKACRKNERTVKYFFEPHIYHDFRKRKNFVTPNLVCFFNAGLYRSTGYKMEDTWPDTIKVTSDLNVPVVVTAYTEYELPLDMERFEEECGRELKIVQKPEENPFSSTRPERNFISDDEAPLMYKNYFCFVVE
uniref:MYND-type domain-containing protein n=1 Tax=Stomoxys calcitrans TaxID=35570 RepID=A0A1I8NTR0_STOCA